MDSKSLLVQVMAWCRQGNKPLPEPMMTQFTDAYMCHLSPVCNQWPSKAILNPLPEPVIDDRVLQFIDT